MKRFLLGVAVGCALGIGAMYLLQAYYQHKYRLLVALSERGREDIRRALPDTGFTVVSVLAEGDPGGARLNSNSDGEYLVEIEYLRGCVFKEIKVPYQVKQGDVQPQEEGVFQRLDAAAKAVSRKGCAAGAVAGQ
jgi:hypothetical protein